MQESICKHCQKPIYRDEEDPVPSRRDIWSANKIWYEIWCSRIVEVRHEPTPDPAIPMTLDQRKHLLAVKEIMHRDLMQEIEELRRDIAAEEIKKWQGLGVKS